MRKYNPLGVRRDVAFKCVLRSVRKFYKNICLGVNSTARVNNSKKFLEQMKKKLKSAPALANLFDGKSRTQMIGECTENEAKLNSHGSKSKLSLSNLTSDSENID